MSNDNNDTPTVTNIANGEVLESVDVEKRPNILVRGYRKARQNPTKTLAVAGGAVLVAGAAFLGRKTAPSIDTLDYDFAPAELETDEVPEESNDTTVA